MVANACEDTSLSVSISPQSYASQPDWDCVIFEESKTFLGELFSSGVQFRLTYDDDSLIQQLKLLLSVLHVALFLRMLSS